VAVLSFWTAGIVTRGDCKTIAELSTALQPPLDTTANLEARLYVVEDLSSDVIELLGAEYDIDPLFFRGQISDYLWHNPRDPWMEVPSLEIMARGRSFVCAPYIQARYFRDKDSLRRARDQAGGFNVLRRIDSNHPWEERKDFDAPGSVVGFVRSKMSFWYRENKPDEKVVLGVLLVDPTVNEGYPLWGGYQNFENSPSIFKLDESTAIPPRSSAFEEAIYWTQTLSPQDIRNLHKKPRLLMKKALLIVCAEWTTVTRYLITRLVQLWWIIREYRDSATNQESNGLNNALNSLSIWRSRVSSYQDLLSELMDRVIFPTTADGLSKNDLYGLRQDFKNLQTKLVTTMARADHIDNSIIAAMSTQESKKVTVLNQSAVQLTYLAVAFVPLSWVSSFYSMSSDVSQLQSTFKIYFITALPLAILALALVRYGSINYAKSMIEKLRFKK
jgi:hypothetical protein